MTVSLETRQDINLDNLYRVAWQGQGVRLSHKVLSRIASCRQSFLDLIDNDPNVIIYGVTTAMGEFASLRLTHEQRDRHARLKPYAAATSFGENLPERVVRGIVLARLANFIEGHSATSPRIAMAVAGMLDGTHPLPAVASWGHGGAARSRRSTPCSPSSRAASTSRCASAAPSSTARPAPRPWWATRPWPPGGATSWP